MKKVKTISSRRLLREMRKAIERAKKDTDVRTLVPRMRNLIEGLILYSELRRKRK